MSGRDEKLGKTLHKWIRFSAGLAFWLHAFLLFALPVPPLEDVANRVGMNASEMLLGLFFISMAVLNLYGFWKFVLDILYVYTFPFIFIYKFCAMAFKVAHRLTQRAFTLLSLPGASYTWVDFAKQWTADDSPWLALAKPSANQVINTVAVEAKAEESKTGKIIRKILLPLKSFTLAWCLVIVSTDKKWLMFTGLIVVCVHLALFVIRLATGIFSVKRLMTDAEQKILAHVRALYDLFAAATDDALANQDIANAANMLALFRGAAFLLIQRAEIRYLFVFATFVAYAGIYVRISMLFGFIYLGIAKLHHVPLTFADSMVATFVMPVSYTNLPHDWLIQLAEDFHTFIAVFLGAETLYSYIQSKLEGIQLAATGIYAMLDPVEVRTRMAVSAKRAAALRSKLAKPSESVLESVEQTIAASNGSTT